MEEKKKRSRKPKHNYDEFPDFGKIPPQALEEEEAVLGALMIESDSFGRISEIIRKPEFFYKVNHRKIFAAIQTLARNNIQIDMITVKNQLQKDKTLEEVGGIYAIASLTEKLATAAHIEYHAQTIAEKYLARQMILISNEIQVDAFDPSKNVEELLQDAEGKIFDISQTNHKKDVMAIGEIIPAALKRIEDASHNEGTTTGTPSGFHRLDKITSGWQSSDLIIMAARPAMGKTAFVLSMAKNMALNNTPVAFFTLEMSNVQLVNRLIVNACELTGDKIKSGKLSDEEFKELTKGTAILEGLPLYIDETPSLSVMELRTKARRLVAEHGVKVIIIDYLQLMNASGMSYSNREGEVSIISRSLKALAKELDIPIIALSQLNRNVESRGGGREENKLEAKKPQLSDLRESGAIEQDADIVCFIHRPEYYRLYEDTDGSDLRGVAQVIIAKHRNGATEDVDLFFANDYAMFVNTRQEYERLKAKSVGSTELLGSKRNKKNSQADFITAQDNSYYEYPIDEELQY